MAEGVTNQETQPIFDVRLTLADDNKFDPLFRTYDFTLVMVKDYKDPIFAIIEEARKQEVILNYERRVYDLTQTSIDAVTEVKSSTKDDIIVPQYTLGLESVTIDELRAELDELDEVKNPKPAPVIESFSNDGRCKIRFNTPMKVPDLNKVADSKVALRMTKAVT